MSDSNAQAIPDQPVGPVALDPFGLFVGTASRIPGLGGELISYDPQYVFHTNYAETARGRVSITVFFENLKASRGTLVLKIHMLALDGLSQARLVTTERILLEDLIASGGWKTIEFEGFRGMSFAMYGQIPDDTDISADAIHVALNNPPTADSNDAGESARRTSFDSPAMRHAAFIVDLDPPIFAEPVSQSFTFAQTVDAEFKHWGKYLAYPDGAALQETWQEAFILQALKRYGLLQAQAHALGLVVGGSKLPVILALHGLIVTATDVIPSESIESNSSSVGLALGPKAIQVGRIDYRTIDPLELPEDLIGFDLMWSVGLLHRVGPIAEAIGVVDAGLRCLRPGGLAVHTFDISPFPDDNSGRLSPNDIKRAAVVMISRGHQVARLKFQKLNTSLRTLLPKSDAPNPLPFGLIIRKGASS